MRPRTRRILLGTTFDLFDWNRPLDPWNRFAKVELPPGTTWDLSRLYDTGEVVLTAVLPVDQHFSTARVISSGLFRANSVAVADLDADAAPDVVGVGLAAVEWYRNTGGHGAFDTARIVTQQVAGATDVVATDLDGDGDIDVIASSARDHTIAWYANQDGAGTFGPRQVVDSIARFARAVCADDLDGDGDIDILGASTLDNTVAWYANLDGKGLFGSKQVVTAEALLASDVTAADIDGDHDLDVVASSGGDNTVAWWENVAGDGSSWQKHVITTEAVEASAVFVADLDRDGHFDVLSASLDDDTIAWYPNEDGVGTFGARQIISPDADGARSVHASDLDGDGDMDVLSASEGNDQVVWYENNGRGGFAVGQVISSDAQGTLSVLACDIDRDGLPDVLSASAGDHTIAWYRNVPSVEDTRWPSADIVDVTPDPRIGAIDQLTIVFDEPIVGFDPSDILVHRDGQPIDVSDVITLTSADQQTWTLSGMAAFTDHPGHYEISLPVEGSRIVDRAGNVLRDHVLEEWSDVRVAGDANLDRQFNQLDIVRVLQSGGYLSAEPAVWVEGDWNGDGVFDQLDIVAALQTGTYLKGPYTGLVAGSVAKEVDQLFANVGTLRL